MNQAEIAKLASFSEKQQEVIFAGLEPAERYAVQKELEAYMTKPQRHWYCPRETCNGEPHAGWHWCSHPIDGKHNPWCKHARTPQRPPDQNHENPYLTWFFSGGRGTGKTRAGAEWVLDLVWNKGYKRIALVGRTPADVRDVMIGGDSGILACSPPNEMPNYEPTKRRLTFPNGAMCFTYSAAAPSQLRGPQHDAAWCDELAAWTDAPKGDVLDTSWNNLMLGLRLGADPRVLVKTTPKRVRLVKEIMERKTTVITSGTTYDNLSNLADSFRESVLTAYAGTRIGEQELNGILLTDVEGAMWQLEMIDKARGDFAKENKLVVVGDD